MGKKDKQTGYAFIRDPDYGWRPVILEETRGDQAIVSVPEFKDEQSMMCGTNNSKKGEQGTVNLNDYTANVLPLQNVDHSGNIQEFADMVKLPYLHEVSACRMMTLYSDRWVDDIVFAQTLITTETRDSLLRRLVFYTT